MDALFDVAEARHPMWTAPHHTEALRGEVRAVRKEIARQLTRFDGRTDMQVAIAFCQGAYEITLSRYEATRLIGQIVLNAAQTRRVLEGASKGSNKSKTLLALNRRDAGIIQDLCDKFVKAITKEVLS